MKIVLGDELQAMLALSVASAEAERVKAAEPPPKPFIRRGYGTGRCVNPYCNRTISFNKAYCLADAPPEVKGE